jgi:hypothetical protein
MWAKQTRILMPVFSSNDAKEHPRGRDREPATRTCCRAPGYERCQVVWLRVICVLGLVICWRLSFQGPVVAGPPRPSGLLAVLRCP